MKNILMLFALAALVNVAWTCCVFNGRAYSEGQKITYNTCILLKCKKSAPCNFYWVIDGFDSACSTCISQVGHTFRTFDRFSTPYTFTGTCNYTLTQYWYPNISPTKNYFGIHSEFGLCPSIPGSCFHVTTFKINHRNAVEFIHSATAVSMSVNGNSHTPTNQLATVVINGNSHPLIAASFFPCILAISYYFSVFVCPNVIYIWTKTYKKRLNGLCGYYDGNWVNDQTPRDATTPATTWYPSPINFPISWMTSEQSDCGFRSAGKAAAFLPVKVCSNYARYLAMCQKALGSVQSSYTPISELIETCVQTLCKDPTKLFSWLKIVADNARIDVLVKKILSA